MIRNRLTGALLPSERGGPSCLGKTQSAIWLCFSIFLGTLVSESVADIYVTAATTRARALGMGGAFTSIQDQLQALDFNPACFVLNPSAQGVHYRFYFNTLFPVLILQNRDSGIRWDNALGWMLRGAAISFGRIQIGLLLGEQSLWQVDETRNSFLFKDSLYRRRRNMELGASLLLSPNVSIGMAGDLLIRGESRQEYAVGYRYGMYLRTRSNIHIGLCFIDLPDDYASDRIDLERFADETLNIGVSYTFFDRCRLSLDIRNVSDDGKGAVREPHIGMELYPFSHVHLQGGYFLEKGGNREVYSCGIGLLDLNRIWKRDSESSSAFLMNVAILWSNDATMGNERWYLVSSTIEL